MSFALCDKYLPDLQFSVIGMRNPILKSSDGRDIHVIFDAGETAPLTIAIAGATGSAQEKSTAVVSGIDNAIVQKIDAAARAYLGANNIKNRRADLGAFSSNVSGDAIRCNIQPERAFFTLEDGTTHCVLDAAHPRWTEKAFACAHVVLQPQYLWCSDRFACGISWALIAFRLLGPEPGLSPRE